MSHIYSKKYYQTLFDCLECVSRSKAFHKWVFSIDKDGLFWYVIKCEKTEYNIMYIDRGNGLVKFGGHIKRNFKSTPVK